MKCGDRVHVVIDNQQYDCKVYGEVYTPLHWERWHAGPNHQSAIEVYINQVVHEIPINEVTYHEAR